ncbi:MAG: hypothetical protein MJ072_01805, partial [Clostridia bacterium]|nr:hypothetical protein [Clostridia bacterium]
EMDGILDELEKNVALLFEKSGIDMGEDVKFGGLSPKEREKIEKDIIKSCENRKKRSKTVDVSKVAEENGNYEQKFIDNLKNDSVLCKLDLNVFGEVLKIAQFTKGELDDSTRKGIFRYIREFNPSKRGCLYDSTYFYMQRSQYRGRNIFEDVENELIKDEVTQSYGMIAYFVDYSYEIYMMILKQGKDVREFFKDEPEETEEDFDDVVEENVEKNADLLKKLKNDTVTKQIKEENVEKEKESSVEKENVVREVFASVLERNK